MSRSVVQGSVRYAETLQTQFGENARRHFQDSFGDCFCGYAMKRNNKNKERKKKKK